MNDLPVLGAERWPPMLGVVGFDGGYKSAVALAIPPEGLVAEGEEGTGGGSEGFGACCYNDGTCDSPITEFDCTSAGGTYLGDGTDCGSVSCTGVCCEPGCVDDTTPDGCELDGGTFQGFGTTCADDPPPCPTIITGACCISDPSGVMCFVETESDCNASGGRYQGDGTTCDPSPCTCDTPPCHGDCSACPGPSGQDQCCHGSFSNECCFSTWQCCVTTIIGPLGPPGVAFCCDFDHCCFADGCGTC